MASGMEYGESSSDILACANSVECNKCSELITDLINKLINANETINKLKSAGENPVSDHNVVPREQVAYNIAVRNRYHVLQACMDDESESNYHRDIVQNKQMSKMKCKQGSAPRNNGNNIGKYQHNPTNENKLKESSFRPRSELEKRKFLLVSDSHGRNIAKNLNINLNDAIQVEGFVKPGANMSSVVEGIGSNVKQNDIVLIIGGTNDVAHNKASNVTKILKNTIPNLNKKGVEVVVAGIPTRHDLSAESCVNREIERINKHLKILCSTVTNTRYLDVSNLGRNCFTRHGLHMNKFGKRKFTQLLLNEIDKITRSQTVLPTITLPDKIIKVNPQLKKPNTTDVHTNGPDSVLKELFIDANKGAIRRSEQTKKPPQKLKGSEVVEEKNRNEKTIDDPKQDEKEDEHNIHLGPRTTGRARRPPATGRDDFLWPNQPQKGL